VVLRHGHHDANRLHHFPGGEVGERGPERSDQLRKPELSLDGGFVEEENWRSSEGRELESEDMPPGS
jgi:hypothetical protein